MNGIKKGKGILVTAFIAASALFCTACGGATTETTETANDAANTAVSESVETAETSGKTEEKTSYAIGETWTVDGQWSLTITGVTATSYRNEFYTTHTPSAVYIVDYTYTNIGYESNIMDGLYLDLSSETVVDSEETMGYSYPATNVTHPSQTPVGATCKAQAAIGVDNAGSFTLSVNKYDGNNDKQKATFDITVE